MDPRYVQIISIAAMWLMAMWSVRFVAVSTVRLKPLFVAAMRVMHRGMEDDVAYREWSKALDGIYLSLNIALLKPWALVLLFAGMMLMGLGYGMGAGGDIALLVSPTPSLWLTFLDRYMDWASALAGCVGMAAGLAATSPRPTTSALISLGFSIAGVGIGWTSTLYF